MDGAGPREPAKAAAACRTAERSSSVIVRNTPRNAVRRRSKTSVTSSIADGVAAITTALPFSIVLLLTCWSTVIAFTRERRAYDRAERALLLERVGEYYGLEVDAPAERGVQTGLGRPWRVIRQRLRPNRGTARPEVAHEPDPPVRTASVSPDPALDRRLGVAVTSNEETTADR